MTTVEKRKISLEQKKSRLIQQEMNLKLKERKMRVRSLIENGGLITKAGLDHLSTNALYGALLSLKQSLNDDVINQWTVIGQEALQKEQSDKTAIILKLDDQPNPDVKNLIKSHNLKWNSLRKEFYGYVSNLNALKTSLSDLNINFDIEIMC